MEFLVKTTEELSSLEVKTLCGLFESVFDKVISYSQFNQKFIQTVLGYSFHCLMIKGEKIVGCYSVIPFEYNYFGKKVVFGLSVDTMIDEAYRGNPFNLKKMANLVYDRLKEDGIPFVFGFPNDNVYLVRKKILKWQDVGLLDFYILPVNIGAIKSKLSFLNIFSKMFSGMINMSVTSRMNDTSHYNIEKINNNAFRDGRYDDSYSVNMFDKNSYFVYKIYDENSVKTAYIIDVYTLCKSNLENAVKELYKQEKNNIDMIIYVGNLDFGVKNLFRVPEKYRPKNVYMSGKILDDTMIDERVFDLANWNVNLSNYDVR